MCIYIYKQIKLYIYIYVCIHTHTHTHRTEGFQGGSVAENLPASAGDVGLIPGSRRFPGEGNSNPFQYSCLEDPMDRGTW